MYGHVAYEPLYEPSSLACAHGVHILEKNCNAHPLPDCVVGSGVNQRCAAIGSFVFHLHLAPKSCVV